MNDVYGWHCDVSDEVLEHALLPDEIIAMQVELGKRAVTLEIMKGEHAWRDLLLAGEAFIELKDRSWHYVQEPFDYEDEDGVKHHSDGWQATRIEVTGRVIERPGA